MILILGIVRYADTLNIKPLISSIIYEESMLVALSDKHKLSARKKLCLSELADSTVCYDEAKEFSFGSINCSTLYQRRFYSTDKPRSG